MRSGLLRNTIDIEYLHGTGKGTRGQTQKKWRSRHRGVRAEIVTLSGREAEIARQLLPTATHRVTVRGHYNDTTEEDRLKWGTRYLYVGSVNDIDQRGREVQLLCSEEK